jgi:hypothetical protein
MSMAQHIPTVPTVIISDDWTTAAHVLADMEAAWGIDFEGHTFSICVWEGPADPDDFARYSIDSVGVLTVAEAFDSQPVAGTTVYIMDFYWT